MREIKIKMWIDASETTRTIEVSDDATEADIEQEAEAELDQWINGSLQCGYEKLD